MIFKLRNFKVDNINNNFISELNSIRNHIYNSIKYYSTNKYYIINLNKSIWNKKIDKNNVNEFIEDLNILFLNSANYIVSKISQINKKLNEICYSGDDVFNV